ncbi:hypothetical protein FOQG_04475 [Fusarium oxysporum f. sp. raphani 54005]|uniref:Uncharacterized protein n=1 Tax=Fusarium oxysporum f. sp. raphani 54005 TaxID=1089458 RepID=X0CU30_FUSOX|nr:hypothetical protein FOQG_04475 [Fusarium oxysporum f. sp. raphani 54005]
MSNKANKRAKYGCDGLPQVQALSAPGEPIWALRYILSEIAIYIRYLGISPIQGIRAKYLLTTTIPLSSGYRVVSCRAAERQAHYHLCLSLAHSPGTNNSNFQLPQPLEEPRSRAVVKVPLAWAGLDPAPLLSSGLFTTIEYDVP